MSTQQHRWLEDLIWCPSQIYYYFTDPLTNRTYVVYLRWRWDDPWTSELCKVMDEETDSWEWPEFEFIQEEFSKEDYKDLEHACVKKLRELFPHIQFNEPELD